MKTGDKTQKNKAGANKSRPAAGAKSGSGKSNGKPAAGAKSGSGKPYGKSAAGAKSGSGKPYGKPAVGAKSDSGKPFGKSAAGAKSGKGKAAGKQTPGSAPWMNNAAVKKKAEKAESEFRSLLYLLPGKVSAKELAKDLDFIPAKEIEIWEEEGVLEISTQEGIVTFEDIRESLGKEDEKILSGLGMKQVFACDYESVNAVLVRKILETFLEKHGGRIGSDTEDFTPFLTLEEI